MKIGTYIDTLIQKSMTGEEIALDTRSREYSIPPKCLSACMRDRASVNNVAVWFIKVSYTDTRHCPGGKVRVIA